jgi:predicted metal-dependent peptidase
MLDREERRLKKVKISLMRNPKFALWSGILMVGRTTISETFPTACTDGRNEIYGREFVKGLDDKELAFVVLHENLHKALRHLFIWKKLDAINRQLTNASCDYVINLMIHKMDPQEVYVAMPRKDGKIFGLFDKRFDGMNTKQVFDLLMQEGEGGGGEKALMNTTGMVLKICPKRTRRCLRGRSTKRYVKGRLLIEKINGKGAGGLDRELSDLLNPKVDWREVMREFVKSICAGKDASSWRRVNRRFLSGDIYMPTLVSERVGRIAIGVDTSGSIGGPELDRFLSEVKSIAEDVKPSFVDLIYWDSEVAAHEEYDESSVPNIVSSTKPMGGGGTDPVAMQNYLKEKNIKPECIVMLTDGHVGEWGNEWEVPVLWTICGGNKVIAPVGKTIHIED